MSPTLQAKLLRVLQEREFERVGGASSIKVDVRVIAATNKDLREGIDKGWFRDDLYYRLNVITIQVPPLRKRREDIPALVRHFAEECARKVEKRVPDVEPEFLDALLQYPFPGNIRELQNIVQRAVILSQGPRLTPWDLPEEVLGGSRPQKAASLVHDVRDEELLGALRRATVSNNGGGPRCWETAVKGATLKTIHEFLLKNSRKPFSRTEFAAFLSRRNGSRRSTYGTAGKYLAILKENRICVHNAEKANKSRYRLSDMFLANA